ncbi:hypothetical protein L195_g016145 [Trifolium pratense]|uniref:Uncharacterized protein n=1 Tax=Trifolium pratense TaxID=57577 RepID=A0A2K3MQE1_TRIPR|nr:hypothetical protein L195_g016145 [Trifolium pratense]
MEIVIGSSEEVFKIEREDINTVDVFFNEATNGDALLDVGIGVGRESHGIERIVEIIGNGVVRYRRWNS